MKKAILILLTVLLAVSCSQVVYDKLPPDDIEGRKTILTVEQVGDTRNLLLKFNPVPYVDEYAYSINGETEKVFEADGAEYGMLTYRIPDSDIPVNKGSVSLFGKIDSGRWSNIATADFEIILDGIAPDVYLYARYSDKVEIKTESLDPDISYMVVIRNEDNPDTEKTDLLKAENGIITISDLDPDIKYSFNVYQIVGSSADLPEAYTTINANTFGPEVSMKLSKTGNGFEVTSIPSSVSSIKLIKDNSSIAFSQAVNGDTAVINFEEFPSLEYGIFYVIADNETCVSNNLRTATPLTPIENGRIVNYKSVDYIVRLSSEVELEDVTLTLPDTTGLQISKKAGDDNTAVITISNLDSNTEYNDLSVRAAVGEDFEVTTQLNSFKTQSFAGKFFEWRGTFGSDSEKQNFIVYVDDAPEGSDYPYYVYFSKNDKTIKQSQNYEKSDYRLMPLIDNSDDLGDKADPKITGSINWDTNLDSAGVAFVSQNLAYKTNSEKWNTAPFSINPSDWNINSFSIDGDQITVITNSTTLLGKVVTNTVFEFCESDSGQPYISFYNAAPTAIGIVQNYIAKRGTTEFPIFEKEPSNLSTFWLGYVENVEGKEIIR